MNVTSGECEIAAENPVAPIVDFAHTSTTSSPAKAGDPSQIAAFLAAWSECDHDSDNVTACQERGECGVWEGDSGVTCGASEDVARAVFKDGFIDLQRKRSLAEVTRNAINCLEKGAEGESNCTSNGCVWDSEGGCNDPFTNDNFIFESERYVNRHKCMERG